MTEARRFHTIDDLLAWPGDEHVGVIDDEIALRPMSRFEHDQAQAALIGPSFPLVIQRQPGG